MLVKRGGQKVSSNVHFMVLGSACRDTSSVQGPVKPFSDIRESIENY